MVEQEVTAVRSPLGVIAGNGTLPFEIIQAAKKKGVSVVVIGHTGETDPELATHADSLHWVRVGQLGKIIRILKKNNISNVIFAGGIRRVNLFGGVRLDLRGVRLITRLGSIRDDVLLRGIADELGKEAIRVLRVADILSQCSPSCGLLTNRKLSTPEHSDAVLAWQAAKMIGSLDIGQGAVAYKGLVVAVEAVEGTDAMIERAGALAQTAGNKAGVPGPVLVKVSKPQQDLRLDLPTVGIRTLELLRMAGFSGLILEAEKTIILEPDEFVKKANTLKISVEVHSDETMSVFSENSSTVYTK